MKSLKPGDLKSQIRDLRFPDQQGNTTSFVAGVEVWNHYQYAK
jgi:hypothetical protein